MVGSAQAKGLAFPISTTDVVVCVLLNVNRHRRPLQPLPPPAHAGAGGLDLGAKVRAVRPRVRVGSRAQFRIRVTNRGPLAATDVRVVPVVRSPGSAARLVTFRGPRDGVCAVVSHGGACQIARLAARKSVAFELNLRASEAGRLAVAAIVKAEEPERAPANNLSDAAVTVVPRLTRSAPPVTG